MQPADNNAIEHAPQGVRVPLESIERVFVDSKLARDLRIARHSLLSPADLGLHHIVEVRCVIPCPECRGPVSYVQFSDRPGLHIYDAIPDAAWEHWTADLLDPHDCGVLALGGTDALRHVLAVTRCLGDDFRTGCLCQVSHAVHCAGCGTLITHVRVGTDPAKWYDCESRHDGNLLLAQLSEPHVCFARRRTEVTQ
jgi:hypothetical protein